MLGQGPEGQGHAGRHRGDEADLAGVEAGLADFDAAFAAGRYKEALAKAEAAQQTVDGVRADIQAALDAKAAARR